MNIYKSEKIKELLVYSSVVNKNRFFSSKIIAMKVHLTLILLLAIIDFDLCSTQLRTGRHLLGEELYIPYHHKCVQSCDGSGIRMRTTTQWNCCAKGWKKCCKLINR